MSEISQVVFAAGLGTRLRPLTHRVPKAMIPVLDVPLVDLALDRGASLGWDSRVVNVSHLSSQLRDHLRKRPEVTLLDEGEEPLGTAGTLRRLLPELSRTVVTYNCDLLSDLALERLVDAHQRGSKPCTLAVQAVREVADIALEDGQLRFVDRHVESRAGYRFLGAACFDRDLVATIELEVPLGLAEGLLRSAVQRQQVALFEHPGYSRDAGTLGGYLKASIEVLGMNPKLVDPPGTTIANGSLSYIGPGANVEPRSLGPGAIVLSGAEVGRDTRLEKCIVWPGSRVPDRLDLHNGIWFEGEIHRG